MDLQQVLLYSAFGNPLVFDAICDGLEMNDLKTLRCTSQTFNQYCIPGISQKAKAIYVNTSNPCSSEKKVHPDNIAAKIGILTLTTLIENSSGFPCSKFVLTTDLPAKFFSDQLQSSFLNITSGFVTELKFENNEHRSSFYRNIPNLEIEFHQLKSIQIIYNGSYLDFFYKRCMSPINLKKGQKSDVCFFAKLFSVSPNLTKLHLETLDHKFISKFIENTQPDQWQKLQNLSISGMVSQRSFEVLSKFKLSLKHFSLHLIPGSIDEIPHSFLESQTNTLKQLKIEFPKINGCVLKFSKAFPCMKKLNKLEVVGNIQFQQISFVEQFPVLQELSLSFQRDILFPNGNKSFTTLKKLDLAYPGLSFEFVEQTAKLFPKITFLRICGKLGVLKSVSAHMKKVTTLVIEAPSVRAVEFLFGMPKSSKNKNGSDLEALPFVKRLSTLQIERSEIDDIMCDWIILRCTALKTLNIKDSTNSQISESMLAKMRQHFEVHLTLNCE